MQTLTTTQARKDLFKIANRVTTGNEIVRVTTKTGDFAIISVDLLEDIEETVYLESIPGLVNSVKESKAQIRKGQYITLENLEKEYDL